MCCQEFSRIGDRGALKSQTFTLYTSFTDGKLVVADALRKWSRSWDKNTLVDLGSGNGELLKLIAGDYRSAFAVECESSYNDRLNAIPDVKLLRSRMEDLDPIPGFDVALMSYSLTGVHVDSLPGFLGRLFDAMNPGGHILFATYKDGCAWDLFADEVYRELDIARTGGLIRHEDMIRKAGFETSVLGRVESSIWGENLDILARNLSFFFHKKSESYANDLRHFADVLAPFTTSRDGGGVQLGVTEYIGNILQCGIAAS